MYLVTINLYLRSVNVCILFYFTFLFQNVTEEMRLAVTVHYIEEEVSVVPRGAFIISPHGLVQTNRSFGGKLAAYQCQCLTVVS